MLAVSVDTPAQSAEVVRKNKLPFAILADVDRQMLRRFGLLHERGGPSGEDIALPAHLLIDRDGHIRWRWLSRSVQDRPSPEVLRQQIQILAASPR